MKNIDIREEVKTAGVKLWEIAEHLGYSDSTFSRKLRRELTEAEKAEIRKILQTVKVGR